MRKPTGHRYVIAITAVLVFVIQGTCVAEERFGPWEYYPPYYFPPNGALMGICFSPDDYMPKYQAPNPAQPSNAAPPCEMGPADRKPGKLASRAGLQGSAQGGMNPSSGPLSAPYRPAAPAPGRPDAYQGPSNRNPAAEGSFVEPARPGPSSVPGSDSRPAVERPAAPANMKPPADNESKPPSERPGARIDPPAPHTSQVKLPPERPSFQFGKPSAQSAGNGSPTMVPPPQPSAPQRPLSRSGSLDSSEELSVPTATPGGSGKRTWTWGRPNAKATDSPPRPGASSAGIKERDL